MRWILGGSLGHVTEGVFAVTPKLRALSDAVASRDHVKAWNRPLRPVARSRRRRAISVTVEERGVAQGVLMRSMVGTVWLVVGLVGCGDDAGIADDGGAPPVEDGAAPGADLSMRGDASTPPAEDGGPMPAICAEVDCGTGRCVPVDGAPTCACDRGTYAVGLACLADPCAEGGRCFYVSDTGSDTNPGTREQPLRSVDAATALALEPGDYVLFERGGQYVDQTLRVDGRNGSEDAPITFGAYGDGARPRVLAIRVTRSSHVTVRDFESVPADERGPCVNTLESDHVTIQNVEAHDCQSNGIHMGSRVSYGVMIDNHVYDIGANDALVVHSPVTLTEETKVGDHFWIVDNRVSGGIPEQGVDIATGNDDVDGSRDLKVVGNIIAGGGQGCIVLGHGSSVAWVVGNVVGNCPLSETANALFVGGPHGVRSGDFYRVRANVVFYSPMPAFHVSGEDPVVPTVWVSHNTFITVIGQRAAVRLPRAVDFSFDHNIVWTTGSAAHLQITDRDTLRELDDNWYVPAGGGCSIGGDSLVDWSSATGFDTRSDCGPVPGLAEASAAEASDIDRWVRGDVLDHFIPDAGWEGCERGIGAFDCDGNLRIAFEPIEGYADNAGLGWEGPLVVRQRYRLGE